MANKKIEDFNIVAPSGDEYMLAQEGSAYVRIQSSSFEPANANIQSHIGNTSNPHSVTASQVGAIPAVSGLTENTAPTTADYTVVGTQKATIGKVLASTVNNVGGASHLSTLSHMLSHMWSSGSLMGGAITNNGNGSVTIASGEVAIRSSASGHANMYFQPFPSATFTMVDGAINFITIAYGAGGTASLGQTTDSSAFNCLNICHLYRIVREGTELHIVESLYQNIDANRQARVRHHRTKTFEPEVGTAGITGSGRALQVSAGAWWYAFRQITQTAFDTSVAGTANVNVFKQYHWNVSAWVAATNQKTVPTSYNNAGTLTALAANRYACHWVYMIIDETCHLATVVGAAQYTSVANAQAESAPSSLPPSLSGTGYLIGRVVVHGGAATFDSVQSSLTTQFQLSAAITATGVAVSPSGNLASTDVQAALTELQTDIDKQGVNVAYNLGNINTSATVNLNNGTLQYASVSGATIFTFTNPQSSGTPSAFTLYLTFASAYAITWPASVKWPGGAAPSLSSSGVDVLEFVTYDGGTTWRGFKAGSFTS